MIEIWLFGVLVVTLPSAFSVVLVIVALSSVTYLGVTLIPALGRADGRARVIGLLAAVGAVAAAALGLRIGSAGSGGELIPSLAVSIAAAAACGSSAALGALASARAVALLGASREARRKALAGAGESKARQLAASQQAYLSGEDIRAEVAQAEAALTRLGSALGKLAETRDTVEQRLATIEPAVAAGDLGRELRRTRDEVATKLDLGGRILGAAEGAAFRLACGAPLRLLLRRRPRDLARGLSGALDGAAALAALTSASASIDAFLGEAGLARAALTAMEGRRKPRAEDDEEEDDAWTLALKDLGAVEEAYTGVRDRVGVAAMRLGARADMEAVTSAAGEVSDKAKASGLPAQDLQDLVDEMTRAESAIQMAAPGDLDARALTEALGRSTAALSGRDGASLDELLRALREVA